MATSRPSMFRFQLLSDLHLEGNQYASHYDNFDFPVKAPVLALLGDIGKVDDPGLADFLTRQCSRHELVFYLLGNHEPYDTSHSAAASKIRRLEKKISDRSNAEMGASDAAKPAASRTERSIQGKLVFLDRDRFDVPGTKVSVLGCTLFSRISPEQHDSVALYCNDFVGPHSDKSIPGWTTTMHNAAHIRDLAWLNREVEKIQAEDSERVIVIFSHHSPSTSQQANDPGHLRDDKGIHSAFATDLSRELCWTSSSVKLWAFGHTHFNCDFVDSSGARRLRVATNQKGYSRREKHDFDERKVIELLGDDVMDA